MSHFVPVAKTSEVPDGGSTLAEIEDRLVVLFNVEGKFYAIDDVCTHDGGPLSDGKLSGFEIACPRHGAKFDIRNGAALTMPAIRPTAAHDVRVEGDDILVSLWTETPTGHQPVPSEVAPTAMAVVAADDGHACCATPGASATCSTPATVEASGNVTEDACREALKQVVDPELFVNIVDLGLIYVVNVAEKPDGKSDVVVEMTMTSPACPAGPQLLQNSKDVLKRLNGVDEVEVKLVMVPPWTPDRMSDEARDQLGIF